jgi:chorismate mutase
MGDRMDELRSHIDRIDDELVGLLNDRQALILEIGELKKVAQLGPMTPTGSARC